MKRWKLLLLLAHLGASPAQAAFERPPFDPEAAGLGGIVASSPDTVFGNPAGIGAAAEGVTARASASRPFGLAELLDSQMGVAWIRAGAGAGVGVRRFGSPFYAESELRISGGWAPAPSVAIGLAVRGLAVTGSGLLPRRSAAVDVSLLSFPEPGTRIGAVLDAVLGDVPGDEAARLRRTALGASRRLAPGLSLHAELQRREDRELTGVVGVSWTPASELTLRAGAREEPPGLSWGFSVRAGAVEVSGSAVETTSLGRTVRLGIRLRNRHAPPYQEPPGSSQASLHGADSEDVAESVTRSAVTGG